MEEPSSSQSQNSIKLEATDDSMSFDKDTKPFSASTSALDPSLSQQKQSLDISQPTASTQSVLLNSFSPSKFSQLNGNKITIVPLTSSSGNVMPIKRVVQVNTVSNAPVSSLLSSSPNRALNVTPVNSANIVEKSPNKIITSINSNSNGGNTTSANLNATVNTNNKIQYVKIVNMGAPNSSIQNTNNTNITQISGVTPTAITNSSGFKITTINANANSANSSNLQDGTSRSLSTILSSMNTRATLVATAKPGEFSSASLASSALSEAVNNITPATSTTNSPPSAVKLPTTYQLVNVNPLSSTQSSSPRFTTTTTTTTIPIGLNSTFTKATPVIQRIQSIQTANTSQPITKTIVSTSTTNASAHTNNNNITQPSSNNYKVLTQQLPPSNTPVITQINSLKSLSTNSKIQNPIVITKTVSSGGSSGGASITLNTDFNNEPTALNTTNSINRKQIITSVKNDSKRPIITTTTTTTTTTPINLTPIANNNNNGSLSTRIEANNNSNNINNHGIENDKNKSYIDTSNQRNYYPVSNNNSTIRLTSTLSSISNQTSLNKSYENFPPNPFLNANTHPYPHPVTLNQSQNTYQPLNNYQSNVQNTQSASLNNTLSSNIRKPCNCTKSMCLKLYCDCFAIGSFCHDCNCINCFNTLEHEDERNKAIKMVLDRNPQAFQSKIGKFTTPITQAKAAPPAEPAAPVIEETVPTITSDEIDEIQSRHIKGCNCKKSNCLKRYCECYLAKIQCSTLCKCVGCKNCDESTKSLLELANAADQRKLQQNQTSNFQNHHMSNSQMFHTNSQNLFTTKQNSFSMNRSSFLWSHNPSSFLGSDLASKSFNGLDMLNSYQKTQLEQQQILNNSYATLTDQAVEITCARLIDCVAEKLDFLKGQENLTENQETFNCDELMESLLIEEFGRCLADIIQKAEQRKS